MNPDSVDSHDQLISRIVDRSERDGDWDEIDRLQRCGVPLQAVLLDALRVDAGVRGAVQHAIVAAERVDVDAGRRPRWARWRAAVGVASGWLLAASLALAWFVSARTGVGATTEAGLLDSRELSRRVVQAQPLEGGRYEVLSVRRVLEHRVVDRLYELAEDEHGRPVPTPVQTAALTTPTDY